MSPPVPSCCWPFRIPAYRHHATDGRVLQSKEAQRQKHVCPWLRKTQCLDRRRDSFPPASRNDIDLWHKKLKSSEQTCLSMDCQVAMCSAGPSLPVFFSFLFHCTEAIDGNAVMTSNNSTGGRQKLPNEWTQH